MLKNILEFQGVKKLNRTEKESVTGGAHLNALQPGIEGDFFHECKPNNCNPSCDNAYKGCM